MNTGELSNFMSTGLVTIICAGVLFLIFRHWKGAEWLKIGSSIVIALIMLDFAKNQGKNTFTIVRWVLSLVGIKM
ncbi:hypothetical protein [Enterococcus faecalis]|uniref:hypothetical protein n=1 Tax=Enterococcus faecalis TaxID=1351 RepID=UPI00177FAD32|nr:hypothetical protein [Enterococcus faecalis]MBD9842458.1 hypothetical protein [Enterococcus faecalis]